MAARSRPWFNGQFDGLGYQMPIAWQGWAVLAGGIASSILATVLLPPPLRDWAGPAVLLATWATIRLKRAN
jgi:hypothetical protein